MSKSGLLARQKAERVEALLYQLKEEGVEFPGRMRDHVAEACKVSKSKLSRLKVIRDKLAPDIYAGYYEKGLIKEDPAYELARLPVDVQHSIVDRATRADRRDIRYLGADKIKDQGKDIQRFSKMVCRCEQGGTCINVPNLTDKLYSNGWRGYTHCGSGCCYDCDELATCSKCCSRMAAVKAQRKAEHKEAKAKTAAIQAERDKPVIDTLRLMWSRMGEACKRAGVDYNEVCDEADIYGVLHPKAADALLDGGGKLTADTRPPFGYEVGCVAIAHLVKLADLLGCSLDYLFGRDVPYSGTAAAEPKWQTGEPPEDGEYVVRAESPDDEAEYTDIAVYENGSWCGYDPAGAVYKVVGWWPMPQDR